MKNVIALILATASTFAFGMDMDEFNEKTHISYFGEYNKGTIGESSSRAFYYQSISGRYVLDDTWTARLDIRLETNEGVEDPYVELNPRVGVQGLIYAKNQFSVFALYRLEVAAVSGSTDLDRVIKPKIYHAANYSMDKHSFSVGVEVARWLYKDGKDNVENDAGFDKLGLFTDFTYRYSFNDTKTFQIYSELPFSKPGDKEGTYLVNDGERHLIGMEFAVPGTFLGGTMKGLSLFPHIDYRPQNSTDTELKDLGVGAWVSAVFF